MIEKEYTFDVLLEVAKSQIGNGLWFKQEKIVQKGGVKNDT